MTEIGYVVRWTKRPTFSSRLDNIAARGPLLIIEALVLFPVLPRFLVAAQGTKVKLDAA
jgi:hypothetical protein